MSVTVDVRARKFGQEDSVWRLFPGNGYKHYDAMRQYSRIFLDLPNLPHLPDGGLEKSALNAAHIARSIALAGFSHRDDEAAIEKQREINQNDYSGSRWSQKREKARGWANALYDRAKTGDVIVVPGPGFRRNEDGEYELFPTLIGEIIGEPELWTEQGPYRYLRNRFLTRSVRWFRSTTEDQFSARAQMSLRTQNALVKLPANDLDDILGAAFKNVVLEDEILARFVTENEDFRSYDGFQFLAFVQATCAVYRAARTGEPVPEKDSIFQLAGGMDRDERFVVEQDSNIHSPGYSTLKSAFGGRGNSGRNLPLVIAVLFAIAESPGAQPFDADGSPNVDLINTESAALDPCHPEFALDQEVRDTLEIIGHKRWQDEWCPVAKAAQDHEGFKSLSSVRE